MEKLECFFLVFFKACLSKSSQFSSKHFYAVASPSPFALPSFFKAKYACLMAYFLAVHFPLAVPVPTTFPSITHSTLHSGYSPDSLYSTNAPRSAKNFSKSVKAMLGWLKKQEAEIQVPSWSPFLFCFPFFFL